MKYYIRLLSWLIVLTYGIANAQDLSNYTASFLGTQDWERVGYIVHTAGDVNGDGYDDFLIGTFHHHTNELGDYNSGATYLILGKEAADWGIGISLNTADARFLGKDPYDALGYSLGGGGDLNGDGFDDILIGANAGDEYHASHNPGHAYVIFGNSNPVWGYNFVPEDQADVSFDGAQGLDQAGFSIAYIGDLNDDGYDEILVAAPFQDQNGEDAGKVYLIKGKASGWSRDIGLENADASFLGSYEGDEFGYSVDGVGDMNNDGVEDFVVGAKGHSKVYLFFGRTDISWGSDFNANGADVIFFGEYSGNYTGWKVSRAGDVNNDGFDDMLIAAPLHNQNGRRCGKVYLVLGRSSGYNGNLGFADASFVGEASKDEAGYGMQDAGDLNGDGYDDFLIGAWKNDMVADSCGKMYVIHGKDSGWQRDIDLATVTTYFTGENTGDYCGYSVATAGDVNGDGWNDIVTSATYNDDAGFNNAGKILLFVSENTTPELSVNKTILDYGTNMISMTLEVKNIGGGTLNWQCTENPEKTWISSITPSSGTLERDESELVTIAVTRAGLANGNYTGFIRVSDPAANGSPRDIPIVVSVDGSMFEVGKYRLFETAFTTTNSHVNPYQSVTFGAHVTGPNGIEFNVDGYWYGGTIWKLRLMPTETGHWTYTTTSSDPQLNGLSGEFECIASVHPGILEINPDKPYTFRYSEGDPYQWNGETNWCLMSDAVPYGDGTFKQYIDTRLSQNFNGIHFVLGTGGLPIGTDNPANEGGNLWLSQSAQQLNPAFFEWMDKRVSYLDSVQMTLGFFMTWAQHYATFSQVGFERFQRYMIARYGAYPLLYWVVVGEFDEAGTISGYNYHGTIFENYDPYDHLTTNHPGHSDPDNLGTSRIFASEPWFDFIIQQLPDVPGSYGPDYLNEALLTDRVYNMPVVNIEFGYEDLSYNGTVFSDTLVRKSAWAVNMGGGFSSYGHGLTIRDIDFASINSPGSMYIDYLYQFFNGLQWWTFYPANSIIDNGYCLKNDDEEYVFYMPDSGIVTLNFQGTGGSFEATWYNPVDNTYKPASSFNGGAQITFATPFAQDAVLHIKPSLNTMIATNPTYLFFEAVEGTSNPANQSIIISNPISSPLNWTASENPEAPWVTLSTNSGVSGDQIEVSVNINGMNEGVYVTSIRITENNATNNPLDILVRLNLNPNVPKLSVTPIQLDYGYMKNMLTFEIKNIGGGELFWNASENPDRYWITAISPTNGSLMFGQTELINVSVDRAGLADGTYWGALFCSSNGGDDNIDVKVDVTQNALFAEKVTSIWGEEVTPGSLRLEWTESQYATEYYIYRGTSPFFAPTTPVATVATTYYVDDGYTGDPTVNYYYVVTAANQYGESEHSERIGEFDFDLITTPTTDFNEIALPLEMTGIIKASDLLNAIPNCNSVARWNAEYQGYEQYIALIPPTDFDVHPGYPYYVNVTSHSIFTLVGPYADPVFNLVTTATTDFNEIMIPLNRGSINRASDLLADISSCNSVARWNAEYQGYEQYIELIPPTNFDVYTGYPYYVNITSDTLWPTSGMTKVMAGKTSVNTNNATKWSSGVPHTVYGRFNVDDIKSKDVTIRAYLNGNRDHYLTQSDIGCGFDHGGNFWIQCGQFSERWSEGDDVVVEIIQCESREVLSRYEVQLSSEPADEMVMSQINESRLISQFELCQNYPNPFNPETTISYTIPEEGHVTIYIYNPLGQKIRTLIHENQGVGKHRIIWDSKNDMFEDVSSGVYFYQIRYKNESRIRKMILMR